MKLRAAIIAGCVVAALCAGLVYWFLRPDPIARAEVITALEKLRALEKNEDSQELIQLSTKEGIRLIQRTGFHELFTTPMQDVRPRDVFFSRNKGYVLVRSKDIESKTCFVFEKKDGKWLFAGADWDRANPPSLLTRIKNMWRRITRGTDGPLNNGPGIQ